MLEGSDMRVGADREGAPVLVREIMTSPAHRVLAEASAHHALEIMGHRGLSSLPVVNEHGDLVGVISEADLLSVPLHRDPRAHMRPMPETGADLPATVADLMSPHPTTATEQEDVAEIAQIFARTAFKSLPVLRGQRLIGVVSRSDLIAALSRTDEQIGADANAALQRNGHADWDANVVEGWVEVSGPQTPRERELAATVVGTVGGVRRVSIGATTSDSPAASTVGAGSATQPDQHTT